MKIIFDTDMDTDCDDAAAMAVLHALADLGEIEILATVVSSKYPWSLPCVEAINRWYGRETLPIGAPHGKGAGIERGSKYAREIAERFAPPKTPVKDIPDAVATYRRVLARQADQEVVVVTVGYLTNLRYLLKSPPDRHSPHSGMELVRRKVRHWVCMGGGYPASRKTAVSGNFLPDSKATIEVVANWPTQVVFTGNKSFYNRFQTGSRLAQTSVQNPVRRVYELFFGGHCRDHHNADQLTVLIAAWGMDHRLWHREKRGHNHILPDGNNEWRRDPDDPRHSYIADFALDTDIDALAGKVEELMIRPPERIIDPPRDSQHPITRP